MPLSTAMLSVGVHGSGVKPASTNSIGQRPRCVAIYAFTPAEYASSPRRVSGERCSSAWSAACVETHRAHQDVGVESKLAQPFGEAPLDEAPRQLHLPEPILRMDKAKAERGILEGIRKNMRHGVPIAQDLDRLSLDP